MKKENEAHYPLVLVTWRDATTFTGWHSTRDSLEFEPDECQTAGFLLKEEGIFIHLAPTLAESGEATLDTLVIPMSWVTKVETLALAASCTCEVGGEEKRCVCGNEVVCAPPDFKKYPANGACPGCWHMVCQCLVGDCWDADNADDLFPCCGQLVCLCEVPDSCIEAAEYMPAGDAGGEGYPPLETKPGDDALGRPLSLDEHIRRGGTYETWPGLIENVAGPGRPAWVGKKTGVQLTNEILKELD